MIIGVGTDIVEIKRIKEALAKNTKFMDKIFSWDEQQYLISRNMRVEYVAGRFAAKEAVAKALGTGFRGLGFKDIEIVRTASGKPTVALKGNADQIARENGDYKIHLSISHGRESAIAFAVLEVEKFEDCIGKNNEGNR
jgi:holo-[acyl-carrier protein] synthase